MSPVELASIQGALQTVNDPEIRQPITELGMVKDVQIAPDGGVEVEVLLTVAGCPMKETLTRDVTAAVSALDGVTSVTVTLGVMSEEQRKACASSCAAVRASRRSRSRSRARSPGSTRSPRARAASASRP